MGVIPGRNRAAAAAAAAAAAVVFGWIASSRSLDRDRDRRRSSCDDMLELIVCVLASAFSCYSFFVFAQILSGHSRLLLFFCDFVP